MPLRSEIAARLQSSAKSPEGMWRNMTTSFKELIFAERVSPLGAWALRCLCLRASCS